MDRLKDYILPDYGRCNVNISSSLARFLGVPVSASTLPELDVRLAEKPKNIVFICFDGMGMYPLEHNLPEDDFLLRRNEAVLTSTFPSTTTCATISLLTGMLPYEHGWFGWSMYIEPIDRNVDIFRSVDSWTKQPVDMSGGMIRGYDSYFDNVSGDYRINTVFEPYMKTARPENNHVFENAEQMTGIIHDICSREGKQFVYAYYSQPDSIMHQYGASSDMAAALIKQFSGNMASLYCGTKDTLIIVTADHGHIDVGENIHIYKDSELMDTLLLYPYLEPRATAFRVKPDRKRDFERIFTDRYGSDFMLFPSEELIAIGLFGGAGEKCRLLGDYIAIGTYTHKIFRMSPTPKLYKGHHTSLTEEMLVPLILLQN